MIFWRAIAAGALFVLRVSSACLSGGSEAAINSALSAAGTNGTVQLCQKSVFIINNPVQLTAHGQELSTQGYPTGTSRATIVINSTEPTNLTNLITGYYLNNVKLLNLIFDGNKPASYQIPEHSSANIELGGAATGMTVANTASRNPRGWSCLHMAGGSNQNYPYDCTRASIINNDIGPSGLETQWADGISHNCARSLIANNTITGATDGGIVLFDAPETVVTGNTIISSTTQRCLSGIDVVDYGYNGNYSNVVISNNTIVAKRMTNVGILMGFSSAGVEAGPKYYLSGPITVRNNSFSGNMVHAVALNGWKDGVTITGSDVSGVVKPNSLFADANVGFRNNDCTGQPATWRVFNSGASLSYWSPGVVGPINLESAFVNSSTGDANYYICAKPAIPATASFAAGGLTAQAGGDFVAFLHKGIGWQYQGDNNLVAVNYSSPDATPPVWYSGHGGVKCGGATSCYLQFQPDANLVNYVNGTPVWYSGTNNGQNNSLVFLNQAPWIQILSPSGKVIWDGTKVN